MVFSEYSLTRKGGVAPSAPIRVTADVSIRMADVVAVLLVKAIICEIAKRLTPELDSVIKGETDTLEEKSILQAAEVFKVVICGESGLEVAHTEGKVLG